MRDEFTKQWITDNALQVLRDYSAGELTLRGLHYRLVARGMTNSTNHYKRVINAMKGARWDGLIPFEAFSDHDRNTLGLTKYKPTNVEDEIEDAKEAIKTWMRAYYKNHWERQQYYVEVWVEKKALQGVFKPVCDRNRVLLAPCKGYPSLTFLNDAAKRFEEAVLSHDREAVIIYFGDYDPSGEDIPRSLQENLERMGIKLIVDRQLLLEHQVIEWGLPPAPAKLTDSRTRNWDGLGQVELDSIEPKKLRGFIQDAIDKYFDPDTHDEVKEVEAEERETYIDSLKEYVKTL